MLRTLYESYIRNKKEAAIHVGLWLFYFVFETVVLKIFQGYWSDFYYLVGAFMINIALFYFNSLLVFPALSRKDREWRFPSLLILEVGLYILVFFIFGQLIEQLNRKRLPMQFDLRFIAGTIYRGANFFIFSTGYFFYKRGILSKKLEMEAEVNKQSMEVKLIKAEKDFLRAQINPHILFNTLNLIKVTSRNNGPATEEAVDNLAEILDYALKEGNENLVALGQEIRQIENIININKIRYGDRLQLQFAKEIADYELKILPLALLTLVENIFKHGIVTSGEQPATIMIRASESHLIFNSSNLVKPLRSAGTGVGLQNIENRLKIQFNNNCKFTYSVTNNIFSCILELHNLNNGH